MRNQDSFFKCLLISYMALFFLFLLFPGCEPGQAKPKAKRVIVIGIDGMGIDGMQMAKTPNLNELIQNGALSLKVRGVMPTVSAPIWGSLLTGAGPEQHGITSNSWSREFYSIEATVKDSEGYFPSIFKVMREQMPDTEIGVFYDWDGFGNLFNHKYLSHVEMTKGFKETFEKAIAYLSEKMPDFLFLYIGHPDEVGHDSGFFSEEYYASIEDVDREVGLFMEAMKKAEMYTKTNMLIVSDHGGVGIGHGGESMAELEVPWIITGPGIIKNRMIEQPVNIYDTASTIAYLFNLEQPDEWTGKPVIGAFEANRKESGKNKQRYVPKPKSSVRSGIYLEPREISFSVDAENVEVRYTVDGSEPASNSLLYEKPFRLDKSSTIAAVAMKNGIKSQKSVISFIKVDGIKDVTLKKKPNRRYPADGVLSLVDGKRGTMNYKHPAWIGFEADDLEVTFDFGTPRKINSVSVECLQDIDSWIFLPRWAEYAASEDGKYFKAFGSLTEKDIEKIEGKGVVSLKKGFRDVKARYLRVKVRNVGICPPGHPGEGERAWLFVDEIIIE